MTRDTKCGFSDKSGASSGSVADTVSRVDEGEEFSAMLALYKTVKTGENSLTSSTVTLTVLVSVDTPSVTVTLIVNCVPGLVSLSTAELSLRRPVVSLILA